MRGGQLAAKSSIPLIVNALRRRMRAASEDTKLVLYLITNKSGSAPLAAVSVRLYWWSGATLEYIETALPKTQLYCAASSPPLRRTTTATICSSCCYVREVLNVLSVWGALSQHTMFNLRLGYIPPTFNPTSPWKRPLAAVLKKYFARLMHFRTHFITVWLQHYLLANRVWDRQIVCW